jgi:hypothetical protein
MEDRERQEGRGLWFRDLDTPQRVGIESPGFGNRTVIFCRGRFSRRGVVLELFLVEPVLLHFAV